MKIRKIYIKLHTSYSFTFRFTVCSTDCLSAAVSCLPIGLVTNCITLLSLAFLVCQRGNVKEKPFLCLDTTIISSLLTDGFGLGFHQTLKVSYEYLTLIRKVCYLKVRVGQFILENMVTF